MSWKQDLRSRGRDLVAALDRHICDPVGEREALAVLEALLTDETIVGLGFPLPYVYAEVRWEAAHALAAERVALGIMERVLVPDVLRALDHGTLNQLAEDNGIDWRPGRFRDPLDLARAVRDTGAWPRCDLVVPISAYGVERCIPSVLIRREEPYEESIDPPGDVIEWFGFTASDGAPSADEVASTVRQLGDPDPNVRASALIEPPETPHSDPQAHQAMRDLLSDTSITPVTPWGSRVEPGRYFGELRYRAAWALAWAYRATGRDDWIELRQVPVPMPMSDVENLARQRGVDLPIHDLNACAAFLADADDIPWERRDVRLSRRSVFEPRPDLVCILSDPAARDNGGIALTDALHTIVHGSTDDGGLEVEMSALRSERTAVYASIPPTFAELRWFVAFALAHLRQRRGNPNRVEMSEITAPLTEHQLRLVARRAGQEAPPPGCSRSELCALFDLLRERGLLQTGTLRLPGGWAS